VYLGYCSQTVFRQGLVKRVSAELKKNSLQALLGINVKVAWEQYPNPNRAYLKARSCLTGQTHFNCFFHRGSWCVFRWPCSFYSLCWHSAIPWSSYSYWPHYLLSSLARVSAWINRSRKYSIHAVIVCSKQLSSFRWLRLSAKLSFFGKAFFFRKSFFFISKNELRALLFGIFYQLLVEN